MGRKGRESGSDAIPLVYYGITVVEPSSPINRYI
jgi:hypothetical protein